MVASQKHVHSFSTNFFGVVGYIASSIVWLLVIGCSVLFLPVDAESVILKLSTASVSEFSSDQSSAVSPVLAVLLVAFLAILFWCFSYIASRILSRIVRRIALLFSKKTTIDVLFKVKYSIHALGLTLLVIAIIVTPAHLSLKDFISTVGVLAGIGGMTAVAVQWQLAKRHRLAIKYIL